MRTAGHTRARARRRLTAAAALVLAAGGGALLAGAGASAQDATGAHVVTWRELDKGSTFRHVRSVRGEPRTANLAGDVVVLTAPLVDASGRSIGRLHGSCITTVGSRDLAKATDSCDAIVTLTDGTIYGQFLLKPGASTTTGVVTGGTGAYAGARGTVVSRKVPGGSQDTLTLLP